MRTSDKDVIAAGGDFGEEGVRAQPGGDFVPAALTAESPPRRTKGEESWTPGKKLGLGQGEVSPLSTRRRPGEWPPGGDYACKRLQVGSTKSAPYVLKVFVFVSYLSCPDRQTRENGYWVTWPLSEEHSVKN